MGLGGFIAAGLSAIFNGSFAAVFKTERVASVGLHPFLFQLYVSVGVFLSSMLCLVPSFMSFNPGLTGDANAPTTPAFTGYGLVAGALFVLAITFSFDAVDKVGIALGQGVWGGGAILVSFVWGVAGFGNTIANTPLAVFALVLLMSGVAIIAFCEQLGERVARYLGDPPAADALLGSGSLGSAAANGEGGEAALRDSMSLPVRGSSLADGEHVAAYITMDGSDETKDGNASYVSGLVSAALVGVFGGSILVPAHYVPTAAKGLGFVPSFGLGAMLASPTVLLVGLRLRGEAMPPLHVAQTLPAGIFSGLVWNVSNICSIAAIPSLGYAVAYPMLQCALFFGALWGVFAFGEIQGRAVPVLFGGGTVLLTGAALLALSVNS